MKLLGNLSVLNPNVRVAFKNLVGDNIFEFELVPSPRRCLSRGAMLKVFPKDVFGERKYPQVCFNTL